MPLGKHHEALGRHDARLRIGAERAADVSDPVAHLHVAHARSDFLDDARGLGAEAAWHRWRRIEPAPEIGLDVVEAHRGVADARLARAGLADLHLVPLQDFGAAGLVEANGMGHGGSPLRRDAAGTKSAVRLSASSAAALS